MKKKFKICVLVLVMVSMLLGISVTADVISRPDVMYSDRDFSLNNPEALASVRNMIEAQCAYYPSFGGVTQVVGPFNKYYIHEDGEIELRFADYHVFFASGDVRKITLMYNPVGGINACARAVSDDEKDFINENHIIIGNEELTYVVSESNTYTLEEYCTHDSGNAKTMSSAVKNVLSKSAKSLYKMSKPKAVDINVSMLMSTSSDEIHGIEVPIVGMGYDTACYAACTASIIRLRAPDKYGDLTSKEVQEAGMKRNSDYNKKYVNIDLIYDVMMKDFLDKAGSHYSIAFDIEDKPMSQTSYKSIIDHGCVMLGMFRTANNDIHAAVLCQYTQGSSGAIMGRGMDPISLDKYVEFEWKDDFLVFVGAWNGYVLRDHITSYH